MFGKAYKLCWTYLSHAVQFITCRNDTQLEKLMPSVFMYKHYTHFHVCLPVSSCFDIWIGVVKPHLFKQQVWLVLLVIVQNWRGQMHSLLWTMSGRLILALRKPYSFVHAVTEARTHHTHTPHTICMNNHKNRNACKYVTRKTLQYFVYNRNGYVIDQRNCMKLYFLGIMEN